MMEILYELKENGSKNDLEMIVAVCWAIWRSRNLFIFEKKREDFQQLVVTSDAILHSYRRIQEPKEQSNLMQKTPRQQTWTPPPEGWF